MSKIDLDQITSGYNLSKINSNFQKIEDTLNQEVLYRKNYVGEPNEMRTNLDMNGNKILNVVTGTSPSDLATRGYVDEEVAEERVYVDQQLGLVNSELDTKYDKTGGPVFGDINLNGHKLIGASEVQTSKTSTSLLEINGVPVVPGNSVIDPYNGTREALRRSYAEAGYSLVDGSFEAGGTLVNTNDVLLYEAEGKAYSWDGAFPPSGKVVPPGSTPLTTGGIAVGAWISRFDTSLRNYVVNTTTATFKNEYGFSAVENMIAGRVKGVAGTITHKAGNIYSTGSTTWKCKIDAANTIADFSPLKSVDFREYGAVSDNSTDCRPALITARTAGFKTLFNGQFYMAGTNVLIDGFPIEMTEGSFIRCDTDPGKYSKYKLLTDFRIQNTRFGTDVTLPENVSDITRSSLSAGAAYLSDESLSAISLATAETTNITGYNTRSTFSGVVVDDLVLAWPTPSPVESGFFVDVETGSTYESTFLLLNSIIGGSAFTSVLTTTDRYFFDLTLGNTDVSYAKISSSESGSVIRTFTTDPNANLAIASNGGGVTASIRITAHNEFEFYLNDVFVARETVNGYIQQAGFTTITAGEVQISKPVRYLRKTPKGSKSFKVLCIGDSQTFGVGTAKTWPDYLQVLASNTHGLGDLDVTNIAVSGTGAAYWDSQVIDYSQYDYVMVMIGTNDVQGLTPINSYGNYIQNIITDIKTQGATPVVGVFPLWTTIANSGSGDPFAQNNQLAARYRSELKSRCAITGAVVANPLGYLGNNMSRMSDNIHPDDQGCISIASAFVAALSTHAGPRREVLTSVVHHPKLLGGWQNSGGIYPPLTYVKDSSGMVTVTGTIRNGVELFETFATLPVGYRPAKSTVFPCVMNNAFGTMWIESNGNMQFMTGNTSDHCSIHATFFAA